MQSIFSDFLNITRMLFRRQLCIHFTLLSSILFILISLQTFSYFKDYGEVSRQRKALLQNRAYKVFFLAYWSKKDFDDLISNLSTVDLVSKDIMIFGNNLYLEFYPPGSTQRIDGFNRALYEIFNLKTAMDTYFNGSGRCCSIINRVFDVKCQSRRSIDQGKLQQELLTQKENESDQIFFKKSEMITDILNKYRKILSNKITNAAIERKFNKIFNKFLAGVSFNQKDLLVSYKSEKKGKGVSPYYNLVSKVIPINTLNILITISQIGKKSLRNTGLTYEDIAYNTGTQEITGPPALFKKYPFHKKIHDEIWWNNSDLVPRFAPIYIENFVKPHTDYIFKKFISVESVDVANNIFNELHRLNSEGKMLYNYSKLDILGKKVVELREKIKKITFRFILLDVIMGISFPFILSLFGYIYLKKELSFMIMNRNVIRRIILIFFFVPTIIIFVVKFACFFGVFNLQLAENQYVLKLCGQSFLFTSICFYFLNRFCFIKLCKSKRLELLELYNNR